MKPWFRFASILLWMVHVVVLFRGVCAAQEKVEPVDTAGQLDAEQLTKASIQLVVEGDEALCTPQHIETALEKYIKATELFERVVRSMRPDVAERRSVFIEILRARFRLKTAQARSMLGMYEEAVEDFQRSIESLERLNVDDSAHGDMDEVSAAIRMDHAQALLALGSALGSLGDDKQAAGKLQQALGELEQIREQSDDPELPDLLDAISTAHHGLAQQSWSAGEVHKTADHIRKCIELAQTPEGKAEGYLLQCKFYLDMQQVGIASRSLDIANDILRGRPEATSATFAECGLFEAKADLERAVGDIEAARESCEFILDLYTTWLPKGNLQIIAMRSEVANLSNDLGDRKAAVEAYETSLLELEERFGVDAPHPEIIRTLIQLGSLAGYDELTAAAASAYLDRAAALLGQAGGMKENELLDLQAAIDSHRGHIYMKKGDFVQARAAYERVRLANDTLFSEQDYPNGHPDIAGNLSDLGRALAAQGDLTQAFDLISRSLRIRLSLWHSKIHLASPADAVRMRAELQQYLDALLAVSPESKEADEAAYALCFQVRNAVFNALSGRRQLLLLAEQRPEIAEQLVRLANLNSELIQISGDGTGREAEQGSRLLEILQKKVEAERAISKVIIENPDQTSLGANAAASLIRDLPADCAYVDIIKCRNPTQGGQLATGEYSYSAFVLRNQQIVRVDLGPADPIDSIIEDWRERIIQGQPQDALFDGEVHRLLWKAIGAAVGDAKTVLISPDGEFAGVPWNAIRQVNSERYLLHLHSFVTVPSGQFLLRILTQKPAPFRATDRLVVVADVEYGSGPASDSAIGREHVWSPLPITAEFAAFMKSQVGDSATIVLSREHATCERVFEHLADPQLRWAVFDTHAFFGKSSSDHNEQKLVRDYPLLNCGLVFANANRDGFRSIASGEAFTGSSIQSPEYVALLACESALGDVIEGEGVFNFQRAFHLAGSRCVLGSLWSVDASQTNHIMKKVHKSVFEKGLTISESLRKAQIEALDSSAPDPYFWATWTLSGDAWLRMSTVHSK